MLLFSAKFHMSGNSFRAACITVSFDLLAVVVDNNCSMFFFLLVKWPMKCRKCVRQSCRS